MDSMPKYEYHLEHGELQRMMKSKKTFESVMQRELDKAVRHGMYVYSPLFIRMVLEQFIAMDLAKKLISRHPHLKDPNKLLDLIQKAALHADSGDVTKIAQEAERIASLEE